MQITRRLLIAISAALLLATPLVASADDAQAETIATAWAAVDDGALLIDVRSPEEFESGHLEGAINIPHTDIDALAEAIGDPANEAVLYCGSGRRSGLAIDALEERGYTALYNGLGYKAMQAARP